MKVLAKTADRARPRRVISWRGVAAQAAATAVVLAASAARAAAPIEGDWAATSEVIVHIGPCAHAAGQLCGTITAWPRDIDGRAWLDDNNPDARLRIRPLVGVEAIRGLRETGPGKWSGHAYNPEDGRTYDATLEIAPNGMLDVQDCLLKRCITLHWRPFR